MKIVTLSDTHGFLPTELPVGDVLVISGDVCPASDHSISHQKWWLEERFNEWLEELPYDKDHIVMIAGNHDLIFMNEPQLVPKLHCQYLEDSGVTIDGVNFYGYPHTPIFCNWAFNRTPEYLERAADKIPENTDVLLTHGPPYGILDVVTENCYGNIVSDKKEYLGCKGLKKRLNKMPDIKLHVFGHIHSSHGIVKPTPLSGSNTTFVNASYINENYDPAYDTIIVEV